MVATRDFSKLIRHNHQVVLADPPWQYYGSATKDQAAAKHYRCMSPEELAALPVETLVRKNAVCLMWATGPHLASAIALLNAWSFHYRGVFQVWIKTNKAGKPIGAQGVRPSFTKQLDEFLLVGSTQRKGRTLPLRTESMPQNVFAPRPADERGKPIHSAKPEVFRENIEAVFGNVPRVELFCRGTPRVGWSGWGNEITEAP